MKHQVTFDDFNKASLLTTQVPMKTYPHGTVLLS